MRAIRFTEEEAIEVVGVLCAFYTAIGDEHDSYRALQVSAAAKITEALGYRNDNPWELDLEDVE